MKRYIATLVAVLSLLATPVQAATISGDFSTNLVSHWSLEEVSGTRYDAKGTNHLTDVNTVTQGTGIQGYDALFTRANAETLRISDASQSGLDITGDFSISLWYKPVSDGASRAIIGKFDGDADASDRAFVLYRRANTSNSIDVNISDGSTATWKYITYTLTNGNWYHIVLTYSTSGTAKIYINGTQQGGDLTGLPTSIVNNSKDVVIGGAMNSGQEIDAYVDEVSVWSGRVLDSTEISTIYNGGAGIVYSGGAPATAVTPTKWMFFE